MDGAELTLPPVQEVIDKSDRHYLNILKRIEINRRAASVYNQNSRGSVLHPPTNERNLRKTLLRLKHAQSFIKMASQKALARKEALLRRSNAQYRSKSFQFLSNSYAGTTAYEDSPLASEGPQSLLGRRGTMSDVTRRMSKAAFRLPDLNSRTSIIEGYKVRPRRPRRLDLGRKFKAAAWISIIIRRLCVANLRNTEDSDSPYMKNIKFVDNMVKEKKGNLLFNVEKFKANRELRMSEVSKQILNKPRWARSSQELLHVEIALRTIKDYADYPVAIQQRIAEVGEYRKYESRRIIVREGHPAWNFYFILSGSVVVLVMDEERSFVKPKAILKRGQSFGELAIIHSDRRRSTIVAMEDTEMLSIWYEDYEAIFMDGGSSRSEDEFITSLPFIRAWPLSMADDQPEMFRYHFYKRSEIVVRNSNVSSWIIVVKSGSLSVLKRLQKVTPFEWRQKNSKATGQGHTTDQGFTISRKSMKKQNQQKKKAVEPTPVSLQNVREISSLDQMDFKQEILTAADDLDKGYITADKKTGDDNSKPMFVHVQTLTKGQAFGLYDIVLGQQPSFCVVSNGAEVIMIDKEFFLEHATDRVLKDIRVEAQAYPSDAELQTNLQVAVDWDAYKASTFQTVVEQYYRFKV